jgi:outer membrane protein assembly factor BamC
MSKYFLLKSAVVGLTLVGTLSGCGFFGGNKNTDYRAQGGKIPSLEVPPDLTSPTTDDRFVIPDGKGTTFSQYNQRGTAGPAVVGSVVGALKVDGARIERAGNQRWLVVTAPADRVWPTVKDFWTESGFTLARENATAGIMETDWRQDTSKIPQDLLRRTVGRLIDGMWDSGYRDRFRTRIEPGAEAGTTEIYLTHRGLEEVYNNPDKLSTTWTPRGPDRELEAEMLSRMMVKFGIAAEKATAAVTGAGTATAAAAASPPRATYDKDKGGPLTVSEPFDRAWRRVGLALDNTGFTVEDRDRSKGLFFVRYIDPDAEAKGSSSGKGWLDRLAFWRKDDPASKPQYRIFVAENAGVTNVEVQSGDGKTDNSVTAKRILSLLVDRLK